jgi:hypothetical protein
MPPPRTFLALLALILLGGCLPDYPKGWRPVVAPANRADCDTRFDLRNTDTQAMTFFAMRRLDQPAWSANLLAAEGIAAGQRTLLRAPTPGGHVFRARWADGGEREVMRPLDPCDFRLMELRRSGEEVVWFGAVAVAIRQAEAQRQVMLGEEARRRAEEERRGRVQALRREAREACVAAIRANPSIGSRSAWGRVPSREEFDALLSDASRSELAQSERLRLLGIGGVSFALSPVYSSTSIQRQLSGPSSDPAVQPAWRYIHPLTLLRTGDAFANLSNHRPAEDHCG